MTRELFINVVNTTLSLLPTNFTSRQFYNQAKIVGYDLTESSYYQYTSVELKKRCIHQSRKKYLQLYGSSTKFQLVLATMENEFTSTDFSVGLNTFYPADAERLVKDGEAAKFLSLFCIQKSPKTWEKYPNLFEVEESDEKEVLSETEETFTNAHVQQTLGNIQDTQLIEELKRRGYTITKEVTEIKTF